MSVVATPIGNLGDITLRALEVLRSVDLILCEDTRVTKRLLKRHGIEDARLMVYNEERSGLKPERVVAFLKEGKNIALVTDAGTPGLSDPGARLVAAVREELPEVTIEAVPGPSALAAAISVAGFPLNDFTFLGFLPHKKGRETLFREIAESKRPVVFYESPHRILKTLVSLNAHLEARPPSGRNVVVARELTKIHEDVVRGKPGELLEYFKNNPEKVRGEFVVVVSDSLQV